VSDSIYLIGGENLAEAGNENLSFVYTNEGWITLVTNKDYAGGQIELVFLSSSLLIIHPTEMLTQTQLWEYQVYYFSIFIPFAP
jgi:hypothetical protein